MGCCDEHASLAKPCNCMTFLANKLCIMPNSQAPSAEVHAPLLHAARQGQVQSLPQSSCLGRAASVPAGQASLAVPTLPMVKAELLASSSTGQAACAGSATAPSAWPWTRQRAQDAPLLPAPVSLSGCAQDMRLSLTIGGCPACRFISLWPCRLALQPF